MWMPEPGPCSEASSGASSRISSSKPRSGTSARGALACPAPAPATTLTGNTNRGPSFSRVCTASTDRLDLGLQVPYFDQSFANTVFAEPRTDTGLSDIRALAKLRLLAKPLVLAFKAGVKVPTGEFKNEDGLIPVGEGQWDFDFVGQVGRSFWPLPLYGNIDLGYRVRTRNEQIDRDPGDEWFLNAELGYQLVRQLMLLGKCELLRSRPAVVFGSIEAEIKRITYLTPALLYAVASAHYCRGGGALLAQRAQFSGRAAARLGISDDVGKRRELAA